VSGPGGGEWPRGGGSGMNGIISSLKVTGFKKYRKVIPHCWCSSLFYQHADKSSGVNPAVSSIPRKHAIHCVSLSGVGLLFPKRSIMLWLSSQNVPLLAVVFSCFPPNGATLILFFFNTTQFFISFFSPCAEDTLLHLI